MKLKSSFLWNVALFIINDLTVHIITQRAARTMAHGRVEGGAMVETWLTTPGVRLTETRNKANGGGDLGRAEEPMSSSDINVSGDLGRASIRASEVEPGYRRTEVKP